MPAPVASGWSGCRVGLAPTGKRRLVTAHTPSGQWQDLKVRISGPKVEGYLNGKLHLEHTLPVPVSGRIGVWSKADSVVYFDDYRVTPAPHG